MYVTLEAKRFQAAVNALEHALGGKTQQPILQQMLLEVAGAQIVARASNEEMSIRYRLSATVQAAGAALLPAQFFASMVHDLPSAPLTLVVPSPTDATSAQVRCRTIRAQVRLSALPLDEFPSFPEASSPLLTIDSELLREVIDQVSYAAATHDTARPVMEGISLVIEAGQASFAAADAFRLALRRLAVPDPRLRANLILSAHALRALARVLPATGAVQIALAEQGHQVVFQMPQVEVALRVMAGTFPAYGSLLVGQPSTRVTVPTHVLAEAVRLNAPFAREDGHRLVCRVVPATAGEAAALVLEAQAPDLGANSMRVEEGVRVEGEALTLLVSDRFLAEALAVVSTREVALELTEARRPIVIKPVGSLEHLSIIMPLVVPPPTPAAAVEQPVTDVRLAAA